MDGGGLVFVVEVTPDDGVWRNGTFRFEFAISGDYPFSPPRVRCLTHVPHPNIEAFTGELRLPLLNSEWKPVLTINTCVLALQLLFLEPVMSNPINP
jgi:ubiquitin-conjugating enzyme E2 M